MPNVTATDIEQAVFSIEEIRIVIRAPRSYLFQRGYDYERKAAGTTSIKGWMETRLQPILEGQQAVVIDGNGQIPHGRTKIETVRQSYAK